MLLFPQWHDILLQNKSSKDFFIKMKLKNEVEVEVVGREEMKRIEKSEKAFSLMDRNRDNSISVDEFFKVTGS